LLFSTVAEATFLKPAAVAVQAVEVPAGEVTGGVPLVVVAALGVSSSCAGVGAVPRLVAVAAVYTLKPVGKPLARLSKFCT